MSNLEDIRNNGVKTVLNGKEYRLIFDLNAMAEVEEKYGTIGKAMKAMQEGSIKAVRCVLWAMMLHDSPELTEKEVGQMVTVATLDKITDDIAAAVNRDTPVVNEKGEDKAPASNPT